MGLPISAQMFFAAISLLSAGGWVDRRGWHEPFFCGLALSGVGVFYSWLAPDALHFFFSRCVAGLGYGFSLMAFQGFVISRTDEGNKAQGLTQLFAGAYAGSICGGAAGAMIAERIGYGPVFFIGSVIIFLVIGYAILFMRSAIGKPEPQVARQPVQSAKTRQIFHFLFSRNVLVLFLFTTLPAAMALVGFLNYFSPIYLKRIGASQSDIGRVFMIYGVCLIYVAPFISRYIDASQNKKNYIVLSGVLGGLAFLIYYVFGGLAATATAFLLLGLSESSDASRAYTLKLRVTQELGEGKAMAIFSSVGRLGQVLGPMLFAWLIVPTDINKTITYLGLVYLLITLLFVLLSQSDREIDSAENEIG
jgi:predicted MFS family arabinose efflux permease